MGFIKLILSIVLTLCFMWCAAVVFGPYIISAVAKKVFDEKVQFSSIRVTPKLGIEIGKLDFEISTPRSSTSYRGNIRALTLSLRQKNLRPSVDLNIGTVNIEEIIFLHGVSGIIDFNSIWDFSTGEIKANIKNSSSNQFVSAEDIYADMTFSDGFSKLGSVQIELRKPTLNQFSLSSEFTRIYLDEYDIFEKFNSQSSKLVYQIVAPNYLETYFSAEEVNGSLEISQNTIRSQSDFALIKGPSLNFSAERATLEVDFTSDFGHIISPIYISASNGKFLGTEYVVQTLDANITILPEKIKVNGNLNLNGFEYSNEFGYIGNFPSSTNRFDLVLMERYPRRVLQLTSKTSSDDYPNIELGSVVRASLENKDEITACLIEACLLSDIVLSYTIKMNGTKLHGKISCIQLPCLDPADTHQLEIQNTEEFFRNLIATRALNPFVVAFMQSQVMGSQVIGSGHRLNFK